MHMATSTRRWTRADLAYLPDDGNRYEVLHGELLVSPQASYGHQLIALALAHVLYAYCEKHRIGHVVGPGAVVFGKNELQPDVQVIPGPRQPLATKWEKLPRPILVVEIVRDSVSRRSALGKKRDAFGERGIEEYWVIDPDKRRALAFRPAAAEPRVVRDSFRWQPRADIAPLEIPVASMFA
jgi:Uma2 family endonuclease